MIKFIEPSIKTKLAKMYIQIYCDVRKEQYPIDQGFLVTKIRFQEYVIGCMFENPNKVSEVISAYTSIKNDKTIQEKALTYYETNAKYESYLDGVKRS
jgi:hypothetical protein